MSGVSLGRLFAQLDSATIDSAERYPVASISATQLPPVPSPHPPFPHPRGHNKLDPWGVGIGNWEGQPLGNEVLGMIMGIGVGKAVTCGNS